MKPSRFWIAHLVIACTCLGAVGATGEPYPRTDAESAAEKAVMQYYPPAAMQAGVQGAASLSCGHGLHELLKDCWFISETPQGFGFGAAAMTLTLQPWWIGQHPQMPVNRRDTTTFTFCLKPPTIFPNPLAPPAIITNPDWLVRPTAAELTTVYPEEAKSRHLGGRVLLNCVVMATGMLDRCRPLYELPSGAGFGDAALKLSKILRMRPQTRNGSPQDNAELTVPIVFGLNAPPAPPMAPEPFASTPETPDQACAAIAARRTKTP